MYFAKEAAEMTGLTTAALRYYEKEQLLPPVGRTEQKYRQYSDADIAWIRMIQCLRSANVPVRSIRAYVSLLIQGGKTLSQRLHMAQAYRENLQEQMACLQSALALTQRKLEFYEQLLQTPLAENLTYSEEWILFKKKGEDKGWTPF